MAENAEIVIALKHAGIPIYIVCIYAVAASFTNEFFRHDYIFLGMQLLYSVLADAKTAVDSMPIWLIWEKIVVELESNIV